MMYFLLGLLMVLGLTAYFGIVLYVVRLAKVCRQEFYSMTEDKRQELTMHTERFRERWKNG